MRFARRVFLVAGVFGVVVLAPMFFLERFWGSQFPPPVAHPEFYYGFVGAVFAWQLVYLLISRDPARYRPLMLLAVVAKASFGITVYVLLALGRVPGSPALGATIDLVFAVLFGCAYVATGRTSQWSESGKAAEDRAESTR
jgi:hypothetical protein